MPQGEQTKVIHNLNLCKGVHHIRIQAYMGCASFYNQCTQCTTSIQSTSTNIVVDGSKTPLMLKSANMGIYIGISKVEIDLAEA